MVMREKMKDGSTRLLSGVSLADIMDALHPIGTIHMSVTNVNPGTQFGGTWVAWGSGRVPVGVDAVQTEFDSVEETGGAKTVTLVEANLPPHQHAIDHDHPLFTTGSGGSHTHQTVSSATAGGSTLAFLRSANTSTLTGGGVVTATNSEHTHDINVPAIVANSGSGAGVSTPVNKLPPYITCYMWKRTA